MPIDRIYPNTNPDVRMKRAFDRLFDYVDRLERQTQERQGPLVLSEAQRQAILAQAKSEATALIGAFGQPLVGDPSSVDPLVTPIGQSGGAAPIDATFITQTPNTLLTNEQAMNALGTGLVKNTTGTGVQSIAVEGTDYYKPGGTDVAVVDGGTGSSTTSGARTNLGLVIGTDVEAHDADLTTIAGLSPSNDDVIQRKSSAWTNRTMAQLGVDLLPAWAAWTVTWTNVTVGNGTVTALFSQIGKLVVARLSLVFGSTTTVSGDIIFSLPVTAASYVTAGRTPIGAGTGLDTGVAAYELLINWQSTTTAIVKALDVATFVREIATSATAPFTWGNTDEFHCQFFYEAA